MAIDNGFQISEINPLYDLQTTNRLAGQLCYDLGWWNLLTERFSPSAVAAFALLLYDWIICLDVEIAYVWPARWSLGKTLYFIQRGLALWVSLDSVYGGPLLFPPACHSVY